MYGCSTKVEPCFSETRQMSSGSSGPEFSRCPCPTLDRLRFVKHYPTAQSEGTHFVGRALIGRWCCLTRQTRPIGSTWDSTSRIGGLALKMRSYCWRGARGRGVIRAGFYCVFVQQVRSWSTWFKIAVILPVIGSLPSVLMLKAFAPDMAPVLFSCILVWGVIHFGAIEGFLAREGVFNSLKVDSIRMSGGGLWRWVFGQSLAVFLIYLPSVMISVVLSVLVAGVAPTGWPLFLGVFGAGVVSLALASCLSAIQVRRSRVFHIVNLAMDLLQAGSCVLYPAAIMTGIAVWMVRLNPITWLMESVREGGVRSTVAVLMMSCLMWLGGVAALERSTRE